MRIIRIVLCAATLSLFSAFFIFYSCGGSRENKAISGANEITVESGVVGVYITDDMSDFKQVIATIEKIEILNAGTGATCDVLAIPTTVNIANFANLMQLVNITECNAGAYDTIHIELNKSVQLMTVPTGTTSVITSLCSFVSFKDESNVLNELLCSGPLCSLDIDASVNVLAIQDNKLALDFILKEFDVESIGDPSACAVTVKVLPLQNEYINALGYQEGITGLVSDLTPTNRNFILTRGSASFAVDYAEIMADQQPNLEVLLRFAENNSLRVNVVTSRSDIMSGTIVANNVFVKIEGVGADLNTVNNTVMLSFAADQSASVDYSNGDVIGMPAYEGWIVARLYGYDGTNYLASKLHVEPSGMSTDS